MWECGMLLPVAGLPSKYGIEAFFKEAYGFIDTLKKAGQHYWQILPLGPTNYGDSPCQPFPVFAGNPYFINLDRLVEEGFLTEAECTAAGFGDNPRKIDFGKLYLNRFPLFCRVYRRWKERGHTAVEAKGELWLETVEYCFYMVVKNRYEGRTWALRDKDIRPRKQEAMEALQHEPVDEIGFYAFLQIKFEEQWSAPKSYVNEKGIRITGDIPIYVALDSADTRYHPELFQLDEDRNPMAVAGYPPDGFSAIGQLWGNPLYLWEYHGGAGHKWRMRRTKYSFRMYDAVRTDHFRGFDEHYSIPAGSHTAVHGTWRRSLGMDIFRKMQEKFGKFNIIAEDLGFLALSVLELVRDAGFPGVKVLEFAFDSREESDYLPHNYTSNCVAYTGTHDNNTTGERYGEMSEEDRQLSVDYMNNPHTPVEETHWDFMRLALLSVAKLVVIPVQDYLGFGGDAWTNTPSTLGENWRWRMMSEEITDEIIVKCRKVAKLYDRGWQGMSISYGINQY